MHTNEPVALTNLLPRRGRFKALKKLLSLILALLFTFGVVGASMAQQAAPEEQPAAAAEQTAPKKKTKSSKKCNTKKKRTAHKKKAKAPCQTPS